VQATDENMAHA